MEYYLGYYTINSTTCILLPLALCIHLCRYNLHPVKQLPRDASIIRCAMQAQNSMLCLEQLSWAAGWVGGAFCVASCVHGHHSVWVTDAWRVLQAICQGEI